MQAFRICSVRRATTNTRVVRLDLGETRFQFRAGHAAGLGPANDDRSAPYSIASSPEDTRKGRFLEFLIKVDATERWGNSFPPLRRGARLTVKGALGRFTFPERPSERHFLFIAGGTGIAPMRSMIRHARAMGHRGRISVLYSARTPHDFAYRGELRGMARRGELRLVLTATRGPDDNWRGQRGRITVSQLELLLNDPATLCFVCGPATMVDDVPRMLGQLGVEKSRIRIEEW